LNAFQNYFACRKETLGKKKVMNFYIFGVMNTKIETVNVVFVGNEDKEVTKKDDKKRN
jgi:hypothetical protein